MQAFLLNEAKTMVETYFLMTQNIWRNKFIFIVYQQVSVSASMDGSINQIVRV